MTRFNILGIALFAWVVGLRTRTEGQVLPMVPAAPFSPRPLCNYQMALANQACAFLPFTQVPPPAPRAPYDAPPSDDDDDDDTPEPEPRHGHGHRHDHDDDSDPDLHGDDDDDDDDDDGDGDRDGGGDRDRDGGGDDDGEGGGDRDRDGGGGGDDDGEGGGDRDRDRDRDRGRGRGRDHKRGRGRKHRRRHRHHHRNTPVEDQCCKWLAQVDDQCVCELLVKLPPFLARPVHNYGVIIGRACNFTFSCGSGIWK